MAAPDTQDTYASATEPAVAVAPSEVADSDVNTQPAPAPSHGPTASSTRCTSRPQDSSAVKTDTQISEYWEVAVWHGGLQGHGKRPEGFMLTDELHYMCQEEVQRAYDRPQDFTQMDAHNLLACANELSQRKATMEPNDPDVEEEDEYEEFGLAPEDMELREELARALQAFIQKRRGPTGAIEGYSVQNISDNSASLEFVREAVQSLWKREGQARWNMPAGEPLEEELYPILKTMGFTDAPESDATWLEGVKYALLPGAGLVAMHSSRFRFLNEYLKEHANADTVPDIVLLVGHRKADLTAGKGDDPARLTPEIEGHPINIHVTEDSTEASMALDLCRYYAEMPGQPDWLANKWRNAIIPDTSSMEKTFFAGILQLWLQETTDRKSAGGVLLVIEQPFLPRYRVVLRNTLRRFRAFRRMQARVIGRNASQAVLGRSNVVLDEVAHWSLMCRES